MKEIAIALVKAQKEMSNAKKDSKNPFFKSKYADLNAVREACIPALNNNGIVVLQPTIYIDGKSYVKTILLHESGESLEGLSEIIASKQNDAQSHGSGITYARRYGLQSMVCIGADDDDGNNASQPVQKQQPAQPQQPQVTFEEYVKNIENSIKGTKDLSQLKAVWDSIPKEHQPKFTELKNAQKEILTPKK